MKTYVKWIVIFGLGIYLIMSTFSLLSKAVDREVASEQVVATSEAAQPPVKTSPPVIAEPRMGCYEYAELQTEVANDTASILEDLTYEKTTFERALSDMSDLYLLIFTTRPPAIFEDVHEKHIAVLEGYMYAITLAQQGDFDTAVSELQDATNLTYAISDDVRAITERIENGVECK